MYVKISRHQKIPDIYIRKMIRMQKKSFFLSANKQLQLDKMILTMRLTHPPQLLIICNNSFDEHSWVSIYNLKDKKGETKDIGFNH